MRRHVQTALCLFHTMQSIRIAYGASGATTKKNVEKFGAQRGTGTEMGFALSAACTFALFSTNPNATHAIGIKKLVLKFVQKLNTHLCTMTYSLNVEDFCREVAEDYAHILDQVYPEYCWNILYTLIHIEKRLEHKLPVSSSLITFRDRNKTPVPLTEWVLRKGVKKMALKYCRCNIDSPNDDRIAAIMQHAHVSAINQHRNK